MAQQLVPKFHVQPIVGNVLHEKLTYQMEEGKPDRYGRPRFIGKGFVKEIVPEPGGYMVYFHAGHSIRVRTDAELARLGLNKPSPLINPETGVEVAVSASVDLMNRASPRAEPDVLVDPLQED